MGFASVFVSKKWKIFFAEMLPKRSIKTNRMASNLLGELPEPCLPVLWRPKGVIGQLKIALTVGNKLSAAPRNHQVLASPYVFVAMANLTRPESVAR